MTKVVPSERLRRELLDDVLAGIGDEHDPIEAVARLGARLILQQALEDDVTEFVGRSRYERSDGEGVIYRNGFAEPSTVATTSGPTVIERPRVRDATAVGFESQVLGKGVARTHALEALMTAICSASTTSSARMCSPVLRPTRRRLKQSSAPARYSQPSAVGM